MKNYFMLRISLLITLLLSIATFSQAQDSLKKTPAVKKALVKPPSNIGLVNGKPAAINPATGKPWGYYSKGKYASYKVTHKADSLKKAAVPTAAPVAAAPVNTVPATTPAETQPVDKSLSGQYKYLLTKVYNYQQPFVGAIWKNFMDTLRNERGQLKDAREKLAAQTKTISDLQTDVTNKDQTLSTTTSKADSISFVGLDLTKTAYNLIMWGLVIVVGIIAAVVIAQSGSYRREAVHRTNLYNELEEEYKNYKVKAGDKEKKLARELQTERNKVDELMGRG
jgi:hypothetical protein